MPLQLQKGHVCSYIYVYMTGNPKAVKITIDNILFEASTFFTMGHEYAGIGKGPGRIISYLPLSHVAGITVDGSVRCAAEFGQPITVRSVRVRREYSHHFIFMFQLRDSNQKNITHSLVSSNITTRKSTLECIRL